MGYDLPFEKPLAELEEKINKLKRKPLLKLEEQAQLQQLEQELQRLTSDIYDNLNDWETVQVARHKDRPHTIDYLPLICDDFFELHGDRTAGENATIMAGPASFGGRTVMFIGQEKGRSLKEQVDRNAGQAHPEGYRKAHRVMRQAEKFRFPVICMIDTPGASIALEDEEHGQGLSIAANLYLMARLRVPIIAVVIGEGGSGGGLGIGLTDRLLMLEHSYYTVASPESAATIIWRDGKYAPEAAEAMHVSAKKLKALELIDEVISEPLGGAHRDHQHAAELLKVILLMHLQELTLLPEDELLERRYRRFRSIGHFSRVSTSHLL